MTGGRQAGDRSKAAAVVAALYLKDGSILFGGGGPAELRVVAAVERAEVDEAMCRSPILSSIPL